MKNLLIICEIMLCALIRLSAQTIPFNKFDKDKIDVGTLYIYNYSHNKEKFELSDKKYLYIKTLNDIEVMDIEDTLELPVILKYKLNWNYMMIEKYEYKFLGNIKDLPMHDADKIDFKVDFTNNIIDVKDYGREKNGLENFNHKYKLETMPTYFYEYTDLMELWFALRFYPLDKKTITVNNMTNGYNHEFEIQYEGKEYSKVPYGDIMCDKFELTPKLSFFMKLFHHPKKAFIWLASKGNIQYMVRYKNDNEQYASVPAMEYQLVKRENMKPEEWEQFKEIQIAKSLTAKDKK